MNRSSDDLPAEVPPDRNAGPQNVDIIMPDGILINTPETLAAYGRWKRGEGPKPASDPRLSGPSPKRNPVPAALPSIPLKLKG